MSAAKECSSKLALIMACVKIDATSDTRDYDGKWEAVNSMKPGGAILVRPDNFVAWRPLTASRRGGMELVEALRYLVKGSEKESKSHSVADLANGHNVSTVDLARPILAIA